jgi:hypothetical protein
LKKGSRPGYAHVENDEKIPLDKEIKYMWRQVAKLTCQWANVRSLSNDEKSDHGFMTNFENPFRRHE